MAINKQVILYFIIIFCAIYQDSPLFNLLGEIGRSPIVILCPLMLLYLMSHKNLTISKYTTYFVKYILYLFLITVIFLVVAVYHNDSVEILGENIIVKTFKMMMYPLVALIFYTFIFRYVSNHISTIHNLFSAIFYMQLFLCLFITLEIYFLKSSTVFLPQLHSTPEKFWRVRLLTYEESWVGTVLVLFIFFPLFLVYHLKIKGFIRFISILCSTYMLLSYAVVSESKGFLFLCLLSIFPLFLSYVRKNKYLKNIFFAVIILILAFSIFLIANLQEIVNDQLTTSITFGTRFSTIFSSIALFLLCPIGVGWSGFVNYFPQMLEFVLDSSLFDSFNLQEVKGYLSTTKALSTKTEFFDNLLYGGIFFIIFFYKFFIRKYIEISKIPDTYFYFIRIPIAFMIMAGIIYVTFHVKYDVWLLLALADVFLIEYNQKHENKT
ncbi:MAG: hypothetical protein Q4B43_04915 [Bacteroidota bacterium]|nr:hypothetical protein [Bacteroidota bacterium]